MQDGHFPTPESSNETGDHSSKENGLKFIHKKNQKTKEYGLII